MEVYPVMEAVRPVKSLSKHSLGSIPRTSTKIILKVAQLVEQPARGVSVVRIHSRGDQV